MANCAFLSGAACTPLPDAPETTGCIAAPPTDPRGGRADGPTRASPRPGADRGQRIPAPRYSMPTPRSGHRARQT